MKYNEVMKVEPGTNLVVGDITFPVHKVSDYKTRTNDRWRDLISKAEKAEYVLELQAGDNEVRFWSQILDMPEIEPGVKELDYGGRHFEPVESGTKARVVTKDKEGTVEEDSITSVYADVEDENILFSIERKGEKLFLWYSTLVFDLKSIKVSK